MSVSSKRSSTSNFSCSETESIVPKQNLMNTHIAAFGALLYIVSTGMVTSYSAPATVDMDKPGSRFIGITPDEKTWIASLPLFSSIFGNILSGFVAQKFGRKAMIMLASASFVTGWLMIAYSSSITWIYVGRLISGTCSGIYCVVVPAYIVEIAPTEIRGFLTSGFQLAFTIGVFLIMALGIVLRWSWLAVAGAILPAIAACIMVFMPESPPWLVSKLKNEEALQSLKFLKGKFSDSVGELQSISDYLSLQQSGSVKLKEFLEPCLYKPVAIAVSLCLFQQFTGINSLMAYNVEIFEHTGTSIDANVASTIVSTVQVLGTLIAAILVDKAGRRRLYIISGSFMTVGLFCLGLYTFFSLKGSVNIHIYGWVPLASFICYIFAFSLGVGPVPFIMIPELVQIRARSILIAIGSICCSFFAFITTKVFEDMKTFMGLYGVYWTYCAFSFLSVCFGYFVLPETKGLAIHQIHRQFSQPGNSIKRTHVSYGIIFAACSKSTINRSGKRSILFLFCCCSFFCRFCR